MSTTVRPHVRLANDIAAQFHHLPPDEAAERVAAHLRMFWDPRMRAQLLATVTADGELDPVARAAALLLRDTPR
ncbi:MAG TPA: formate dehydrogenase subunit delta [Pseudonocardiaceae bacterium]